MRVAHDQSGRRKSRSDNSDLLKEKVEVGGGRPSYRSHGLDQGASGFIGASCRRGHSPTNRRNVWCHRRMIHIVYDLSNAPAKRLRVRVLIKAWGGGTAGGRIQMSTHLLATRAVVPFILAKTDSRVNMIPVQRVDARALRSEVNS